MWIVDVGGEKPSLVFEQAQREFGLFQPSWAVGRWKLPDASFERPLHTRGQPSGMRSRFSIIGSQLLQLAHDEQDQTTANLANKK